MAIELYFYRCKKSYYEQHEHDLHALSREAMSADWRWLNLGCVEQGVPMLEPPEATTDAYRPPRESDNVILVNGWVQRAGAVHNWLNQYTRLAVSSMFPVMIDRKTVAALYAVCQSVASLEPDDDRNNYFYFETGESREEYREGFQQTLRTLDVLLSTIDFETEVVLVQTSCSCEL